MNDDKKSKKIPGVKGMNDLLPYEALLWELLENTIQSIFKSYGFGQIRTPIVEPTALFARGIGEVTDIVEKEMYSFTDRMNGDLLTLRPEGTAGIVRAVLEHNLTYDGPKRLWYFGPMFRHERPQRGRYRQFHQFGAEAIGFSGPDIDAELIIMCRRIWDDLGFDDIQLELNSIGDAAERAIHRTHLITHFENYRELLDAEAQRRLYSNPLRILDTKNASMQELVNEAPKLLDYLGEESRAHFEGVQKILDHNNIPYKINPRLVRGIDYYNRTVFEWTTTRLGTQGTICAGGRYDSLIPMLGGNLTPAYGFAIGAERLIELLKGCGEPCQPKQCDAYLVHQGQAAQLQAFVLAERLRDAGLDVILHCASNHGGGSFKTQMKHADASGAAYALILGEDEINQKTVSIKALRNNQCQAKQVNIIFDNAVEYIIDKIIGHEDHEHLHFHP